MSRSGVVVRGTGVAAQCCALLLRRAGSAVVVESSGRAGVPAIMIGEATQALLADVFERPDLFAGAHRIARRVVAWGAEPRVLPHSAVVLSEAQLNDSLREEPGEVRLANPRWEVHASPPLPRRHFGSRQAQATAVTLRGDSASCWMESVGAGWLFLVANGPGVGWLLSVGGEPDALLGASAVVAGEVASLGSTGGAFPAHPRVADPLCGAGWLACGTAAMAFDPICGDGTGNAVREAILAAAVIQAGQLDEGQRLDHYRRRLLLGFLRHLDQCWQFYSTGGSTEWWRAQAAQIAEGITWCQQELGSAPPQFRLQLRGYQLEPLGSP